MKKRRIFKYIFILWLLMWAFFLLREDKEGQYATLRYLYAHPDRAERVRRVMGEGLYDFLSFCRSHMPEEATYELVGFEELSIDKVRARYLLWPLKALEKDADFKIVYGAPAAEIAADEKYGNYGHYRDIGRLLIRIH